MGARGEARGGACARGEGQEPGDAVPQLAIGHMGGNCMRGRHQAPAGPALSRTCASMSWMMLGLPRSVRSSPISSMKPLTACNVVNAKAFNSKAHAKLAQDAKS